MVWHRAPLPCSVWLHAATNITVAFCLSIGELPIIELSTKPRPVVLSSHGDVHRFTLEATVANRLRNVAREEGTTVYTVLVAAFSAFLARSCGDLEDVVIGSPVSCRSTREVTRGMAYPQSLFSSSLTSIFCVRSWRTLSAIL